MKKLSLGLVAFVIVSGTLAHAGSLDDELAAAKKASAAKEQRRQESEEAKTKRVQTQAAELFFNRGIKHLGLTAVQLQKNFKSGYGVYGSMEFKWKMKLSNGKICSAELTGSYFSGLHEKTDRHGLDSTDYYSDDMEILSGMCTNAEMQAIQARQEKKSDIAWGLGQLKQNWLAKDIIYSCEVREYVLELDCYDSAGNNTGERTEGYGSLNAVKFKQGY